MFSVGQVVFSKRGRDKGKPFVVISVEGEYAYLIDGKLRKVCKPKKKKSMHIQKTNDISELIAEKVCHNKLLLDAEVRKVLSEYKGFSSLKESQVNKEVVNHV